MISLFQQQGSRTVDKTKDLAVLFPFVFAFKPSSNHLSNGVLNAGESLISFILSATLPQINGSTVSWAHLILIIQSINSRGFS